jgi:hypothetical protein
MKKFLFVLTAAAVGYVAWIEIQKKGQDWAVWQEVTDPVD